MLDKWRENYISELLLEIPTVATFYENIIIAKKRFKIVGNELTHSWSICRGMAVLSKDSLIWKVDNKHFQTNEFRFPTLQEAVLFWIENREKALLSWDTGDND